MRERERGMIVGFLDDEFSLRSLDWGFR